MIYAVRGDDITVWIKTHGNIHVMVVQYVFCYSTIAWEKRPITILKQLFSRHIFAETCDVRSITRVER